MIKNIEIKKFYPKSFSYSSIVCNVFCKRPLATHLRNIENLFCGIVKDHHIVIFIIMQRLSGASGLLGFSKVWLASLLLRLAPPSPRSSHYTGRSYIGSSHWRRWWTSCSTTGPGCRCCRICGLFKETASEMLQVKITGVSFTGGEFLPLLSKPCVNSCPTITPMAP